MDTTLRAAAHLTPAAGAPVAVGAVASAAVDIGKGPFAETQRNKQRSLLIM